MTHRYLFLALLMLSACTAEPFSNNPEAQFHMPLTYGRWEAKPAADGKSCVITSGYRGLEVKKTASDVSVASVRDLIPGEQLILTVNEHRYETSDTYFSDADVPAIIDDFQHGGKTHVRLRQRSASSHLNASDQTILLDAFPAAWKQCESKPVKKSKKKKA